MANFVERGHFQIIASCRFTGVSGHQGSQTDSENVPDYILVFGTQNPRVLFLPKFLQHRSNKRNSFLRG